MTDEISMIYFIYKDLVDDALASGLRLVVGGGVVYSWLASATRLIRSSAIGSPKPSGLRSLSNANRELIVLKIQLVSI